jgi:hypothetical protein
MSASPSTGGGGVVIGLNAVIVAVTEEQPRILIVAPPAHPGAAAGGGDASDSVALPFGPLDPEGDRTLELGLRRWVRERTGLELGYVEQLYTFGDREREPAEHAGGPRVLSIAYLALMRETSPVGAPGARWLPWYRFLPWEDWRDGRPAQLEEMIVPALGRWARAAGDGAGRRFRRERVEITFGLGGAPWDGERVLERYELLYEVGLIPEAERDRRWRQARTERVEADTEHSGGARWPRHPAIVSGEPMAFDHRRILATALGRLRGKLRYRPVVFELLPPTFTLFQLQRVVEALSGLRLHKGNFRRLVEQGGLVEGTGRIEAHTGGRPAELFRFRREVLRERPAPGVGLPGVRT